jgi:predicted ATP-grasp superfamily ATP-dependent carboligase
MTTTGPAPARRRTPAVVLGLGINGLGVVRALGRAGVPVIGVWSDRKEPGRRSRYCRAVRSAEHRSPQSLFTLLRALEPTADRPALFPTTDADAAWINEEQDALGLLFRFHTAPRDVFARLASKLGIIDLLRGHNVDAPASLHFDRLEEFERARAKLPARVLVKPVETFRRVLPGGAKNELFLDADSLEAYVRAFAGHLPDMVFQEVVPSGDGQIYVCTVLLDANGQVVLRYTGRKIRQYKPDYGVTSFGVSEWNEETAGISTRFLQAIGFRGLCTLEFARHRDTGRYLLLEANPRSYYHNGLCADCGVNFPLAEYALLIGDPPPPPARQRDGVHWIDLVRDLGSLYRKRRAGELTVAAWLRSVSKARSFASLALDDPGPWLHETARLAGLLASFALR